MERHFIGIVIPAYNESKTIGDVVSRVGKYGIPIVVDDGSSDETSSKALAAGAHLIRHAKNHGYEAAINTGFSVAATLNCEYVLTIDADGQHNPGQLQQFIDKLDEGYDVVIGRRSEMQRFSESIFSLVGKILWNTSDPLCGLKAYKIKSYKKLGTFSSFTSLGTELAIRSIISGFSYIELPVITRKRIGVSRFGNGLWANIKILRALIYLIFFYMMGNLKL